MWDERYSQPGFTYGTAPNEFLVSVADQIPQGRVLCLAEGEGRNAVYLAELECEVVAVDSSEVGLLKAEQLAVEHNVHIKTVVADLADFVIESQSWDAIISIFCHLPSALRQHVYRMAVAGLKEGGTFVLEAYTPEQLQFQTGGPSKTDLLVTLQDVKAELQGLDFVLAQEVKREVHEGVYHNGLSAVVQIVGLKSHL